MAIPVIESVATTTTAQASTIDVAKPSGVVSGDLLVIFAGSNANQPASDFTTAITGWTKQFALGDTVSRCQSVMYWRKADGTEPSTTTVDADSSNDMVGIYLRISGVDTLSPINVTASTTIEGTRGSFVDILELTTTVDDCLVLAHTQTERGGVVTATTSSTGWAFDAQDQTGTAGTNTAGIQASKDLATAGASGTVRITSDLNDTRWVGIQIAIAPITTDNTSATIMMGAPF